MTRLWPAGETIEVETDAEEEPVRFVWHARPHALQQIRQHWQIDTDWWSENGRVHRDYYAVTTTDGLFCVLYHDRLEQTWRLAKVYD